MSTPEPAIRSPASPPPRAVALFDLDRTVTRAGTYTPFLLACARRRGRSRLNLLRALPAVLGYLVGRRNRSAVKVKLLEALLAGVTRGEVALWAEEFAAAQAKDLRPGALAAITRHRGNEHRLVLVTASFDFTAQAFAKVLGFDEVIATVAVWDDRERLVAAIAGENCYGPAKLAAVKAALGANKHPSVIAYSDHHTDFELLRWADEGIAVNPTPTLRRLAIAHGMAIADWEAV